MRRIIIILVLLAATAAFVVVASGGDQAPEPTFTTEAEAPATFGVDGPDGKPVICANGKELRVPKKLVFGKPTHDPSKMKPPKADKRDKVWRCGTGANPHLNARLVPASDDPLNANPATTP